jgi:hypothetical protein
MQIGPNGKALRIQWTGGRRKSAGTCPKWLCRATRNHTFFRLRQSWQASCSRHFRAPSRHPTSRRLETVQPRPFPPQRLGPHRLPTPKLLLARLRVIAAAGSLAPARFSGAEPERSQQIALRAKYQIHALPIRNGQPLLECQPARKTALVLGCATHEEHLFCSAIVASWPDLFRPSRFNG